MRSEIQIVKYIIVFITQRYNMRSEIQIVNT